MPDTDQAELVAVLARGPRGAAAVARAWDEGAAVAPLDPGAPEALLRERLEHLRPTRLDDGGGPTLRSGGIPVPAGTGAVVSTSGTTGNPRAARLDHAALTASARAVHEALGAGPAHAWLCCLPLHSIAGLAILARARTYGLPLAVHERFDPDAVAAAATTATGSTLVSLVPTMLARLLDRDAPVARFHTILLGGAPVPGPLVARATAAGARVATTYGMTETGGGCVHDGHPLHGVEIRLAMLDRATAAAEPGATGEILVRGAVVMHGYHRDPAASARAFTPDGWLRTGDVGTFDPAGRLRVVDRLRDLVITGGVNVSPTSVERVLAEHPGIAEVCVAGSPDREWGERVVAFVIPTRREAPPSLEAVRAFARGRLTPAELPREVRIVEVIPRTPGGKPRRAALRDAG
jgi:O-succinylbenzoic acid--CoA ligase